MIQSGLIFALGFLVAGFFALMIAPTIWRRAVFLTRKRIESAVPLTANELQADKDKLRAEHAMAQRKLEILVDKLRAKSTLDAQNNVRQSEEIKILKADLASQGEVNVGLEKSILSINQKLSDSGVEIQDLKLQLSTTSAELAARTGQLESLTRLHQEAEKRISDDERRLGEFELDVAKLKTTVADLREKRRNDQEKVRDMRTETRATAELLKNEKVRSAETEKKYERAVAEKSDIEVKLSRQEKAASRSKEKQVGIEADLQELEQRLADSLDEQKSLEKELSDMTLRFNKASKAAESDEPDKVIATLVAAHATLEAELKASVEERAKLQQELEQSLASSLDERKSLEKELGDMTERFNKVVKAAQSDQPDKVIAAISAAHATAESELKSSLQERDKLTQELEKHMNAAKKADATDGDAALREELSKLAAEVVQLTALVEGPDSRINSLIENAADDSGQSLSLAARVKALKEMADNASS